MSFLNPWPRHWVVRDYGVDVFFICFQPLGFFELGLFTGEAGGREDGRWVVGRPLLPLAAKEGPHPSRQGAEVRACWETKGGQSSHNPSPCPWDQQES